MTDRPPFPTDGDRTQDAAPMPSVVGTQTAPGGAALPNPSPGATAPQTGTRAPSRGRD